ncbi:unnamed protein product [Pleuronectes platessa]|uniref:Ig-like domain-containing protein n=1 Tax=Pleuronectes platessa TaxID=8262 RepID=A0A9N7YW14_PLEPL|nr:unnamed protein product [Pleuronectes platessa]
MTYKINTKKKTKRSAHGVREEPQFVTARAGENVILGCDVSHPLNGQPYVVEWFKYGMPIPFFINFRFYPPHVDPEYAGRATLHGKSSLRIENVRSDDQGWYECKVLMLEQQYDTFHNGSWVHLTVNVLKNYPKRKLHKLDVLNILITLPSLLLLLLLLLLDKEYV